jgi:hypothetical protein
MPSSSLTPSKFGWQGQRVLSPDNDSHVLYVNLRLMRRSRYIWALGAFLVATLLGFDGRTRQTVVVETSSAALQADQSVFLDSAALCAALRLQFHRCSQALLAKPISHEFRSVWIRQVAEFIGPPSDLFYSPIQRRPPPSFS